MSTAGPADPHSSSAAASLSGESSPPVGPPAGTAKIDPQLIQQTKNEIRGLVQEIARLSQSDMAPDQFYEEFLRRVVQALASHGGAFWTVGDGNQLKLEYQINMPAAELIDEPARRKRHAMLLQNVLASGLPTLVPPQSGSHDDTEAGNPTDFLLVLATVGVEQETRGIIEIFQRAGGGPTTQRGYLRFLVQMSNLVGEYLKSRRLRHLGNRQTLWENLERFLEEIHRGLDVREKAYTIVNEGRRLIGCDRVSLAVRRGRGQRVLAISALDTLDRRAEQVKRLARLATAVTRAGRPVWYRGGTTELPPQIEEPLQAYVDQSHATLLAIVPLSTPGDRDASDDTNTASKGDEPPLGALIVEQLEDSHFHKGFCERVETVARHAGTALSNALDYESVFLMPLWRAIGRARWVVAARNLPKTLLCLGLFTAAVGAMVLVPADFQLSARGRLQPAVRREVFAHIDGVVVEVPVRHEQAVREDEVLARLTNNRLKVELSNLRGRKNATRERIRSVKWSQLHGRLRMEDQNRLAGELDELLQVDQSIDRELALLHEKLDQLRVRSPLAGQVVTWNVQESLLGRPVQIGQALMTVVDQRDNWELELYMPERRMGHVARAGRQAARPLPVTFVLASHPNRQFEGQVVEIDRSAEVRADEGNTVRLRVSIDKETLPELRSGTTVTANVFCGRASIGYVFFHELVETVQKQWLLWF